MAEATTLERTTETTETEAPADATTEALAEDREAAATTTEPDAGATEEEAPAAEEVLLKTAREQWEAEQAEARERDAEEAKRKERADKLRDKLKDTHANLKKDVRQKVTTITVRGEDGETFPITLSDAFLADAIDNSVDKAALTVRPAVEYSVREDLIEALVASLPAAKRAAATTRLSPLLELDDKGQLVTPTAEAAKTVRAVLVDDPKEMTLDELPAHLKTQIAKDKLAEYNRGRGNPRPAGETSSTELRGNTASGPKDLKDAQLMHAGMHPTGQTITTSQMRTYRATGHI